ncbi:isochorismatase family protein [Evansella sp. LMS18]|jgi:nicotinamidase-related amidase|uniref:isochorismatase family protein n=1 Tax=Evansella sp. LMS18 TaxID=2924033 RepID=UPI0020D1221A|nr:isochorismatase family protein [Evansella sp. LMS18]UTR10257.1 isochorismatase family protein [Evansella sp. LMS18]
MPKEFDGFGERLSFGQKPAVLVVDFIKGFTDPDCKLGSELSKEVLNTSKLLGIARNKGIPVIFTTVVYESKEEGGYFIEKIPALEVLQPESEWIEVDERLERRKSSEPLITKKFASSFFGTNLSSILAYHQADTLIITGCTTSGCVRATVVDAIQHGYKPVIPEDCVGDRSAEAHNANIHDIQTKYGEVVKLESVCEFLKKL